MFFEEIFNNLNENGVDYVVVGGVALVLHGAVRLTADLDLMVDLNEDNLKKFVEVMNKLGYRPKVPVKAESFIDSKTRSKWIKEKNMKVFTFYHPAEAVNLVDVLVDEPLSYEKVKGDAVKVISGNISIPIVSIKNLIELKRISGRKQDIADIAALEKLMENEQG